MRVEMLAIGDELLDGRVADCNSVELGGRLGEVGLHLAHVAHVPDDVAAIAAAAAAAAGRDCNLCVVSGGLGPTADDVTAEALARLAQVPLARDAQLADQIAAHARRRGRALTDNQLRQADRPVGSVAVANPVGTASGFALVHDACEFIALPGVPREFVVMVDQAVVAPRRAQAAAVGRRTLALFGLAEAEVDHRLGGLAARWPAVRVQFRTDFPCNHVSMHAPAGADADLEAAFLWAASALGTHVFSTAGQTLAEVVVAALDGAETTLALAESCTGGLVGDLLTDVPGCSRVLRAAIVAYHNDAKCELLGVPPATLEADGAVSESCARAMAAGARARADADWGLATTGIAGPGGGTAGKPVGTVWLAVAGPGGATWSHRLQLGYGRRQNKQATAMAALDGLRRQLGAAAATPSA